MTITSAGYYGAVNDAQWAQLFEPLPHWYRAGSFVPSAAAGLRRISLTAGVAFGAGIRDTSDAAMLVDLTPPSSGGQWYLVVLRRVWSIGVSGSSSVQAVPGPATSGSVPTLPPSVLPASLQQTPSATDDAPIVWVHVRAADTTLTIFDARMVIDATGRSRAASIGALTLLSLMTAISPGDLVSNAGDGVTYWWNGSTWKPWDSDWTNFVPGMLGVTYPTGYVARYRYVSGKVRVSFTGQNNYVDGNLITFGLPVPADSSHGVTSIDGYYALAGAAGFIPLSFAGWTDSSTINFYTQTSISPPRATQLNGTSVGVGGSAVFVLEYDPA